MNFPPSRHFARRTLLGLLGLGLLARPPVRAEGGGGKDGEAARQIKLNAIMLPSREQFTYSRLVVTLVVRNSKKLPQEVETVTGLRPRLVGVLTEKLTEEGLVYRGMGPEDAQTLKERVVTLVNDAIGSPLVEEVLIVSLLVG